jgi:hypothetical protein
MHQQLWGYKVEEKLYVGVREQILKWNLKGRDGEGWGSIYLSEDRKRVRAFETR